MIPYRFEIFVDIVFYNTARSCNVFVFLLIVRTEIKIFCILYRQ